MSTPWNSYYNYKLHLIDRIIFYPPCINQFSPNHGFLQGKTSELSCFLFYSKSDNHTVA